MKPREIIGTIGIVIAVIVVILSLGYGFSEGPYAD